MPPSHQVFFSDCNKEQLFQFLQHTGYAECQSRKQITDASIHYWRQVAADVESNRNDRLNTFFAETMASRSINTGSMHDDSDGSGCGCCKRQWVNFRWNLRLYFGGEGPPQVRRRNKKWHKAFTTFLSFFNLAWLLLYSQLPPKAATSTSVGDITSSISLNTGPKAAVDTFGRPVQRLYALTDMNMDVVSMVFVGLWSLEVLLRIVAESWVGFWNVSGDFYR